MKTCIKDDCYYCDLAGKDFNWDFNCSRCMEKPAKFHCDVEDPHPLFCSSKCFHEYHVVNKHHRMVEINFARIFEDQRQEAFDSLDEIVRTLNTCSLARALNTCLLVEKTSLIRSFIKGKLNLDYVERNVYATVFGWINDVEKHHNFKLEHLDDLQDRVTNQFRLMRLE